MQKSQIAGLTYREKEIGEPAYTGTKRVASTDEKAAINGILTNFLSAILAKHS